MDWHGAAAAVWHWLGTTAGRIGLGGGVGILAFFLYMQSPRIDAHPLILTLFDTLMHVIGNGRSGERRRADGSITWVVKPRRPRPPPDDDEPEEKSKPL